MTLKSQAQVERELALRWEQVQKGKLDLNGAFGIFEDWLLQVGERQAFLHPNQKRWFWFQRWNDEWEAAGCGPGEGILLTYGNTAAMKKLPVVAPVDDWCVYQHGGNLSEPLRIKELHGKLVSGEIPSTVQVWSTRADQWLNITAGNEGEYTFVDSQDTIVLSVNSSGVFPETTGPVKPSRKGKTA